MKQNKVKILISVTLTLILVGLGAYIFRANIIKSLYSPPPELNQELLLNYNLKLNYNSNWNLKNNNAEGILLEDSNGIALLITMSQVQQGQSVDAIVDSNLRKVNSNVKVDKSNIVINDIEFLKAEIKSANETMFPSDNLISFASLLDKNIFFLVTLNYPPSKDPSEALKIINTLRYN